MLGPNFPIKIDSNGDGPTSGDGSIVPSRAGNTITIPSQWTCLGAKDSSPNADALPNSNVIELSNMAGDGKFLTASRYNGLLQQSVTIGSFVNGGPTQFSYTESRPGEAPVTGGATLLDQNLDGIPDAVSVYGPVNGMVTFAFSTDGNYISIPWSQASVVGIETTNTCAGAVPQLWIPLADTNGDGRGDTIIPDLDGNGMADGDVYVSPPVAAPAVPAMGLISRLVLAIILGLTGAWFLSHRRRDDYGTPVGI